jgi:hypothetical protein
MINYYVYSGSQWVNDTLTAIDGKLNISASRRQHQHNAAHHYTPLKMCWPTQADIEGESGKRFAKKMYKGYILADRANYVAVRSKMFTDELVNRTKRILGKLTGNRTITTLTVNITAPFERYNPVPVVPTYSCYRSSDCIDSENVDNSLYINAISINLNQTIIDDIVRRIEKVVNISYIPGDKPSVSAIDDCVPTDKDPILAFKVGRAYDLARRVARVFRDAQWYYNALLVRLDKILDKL